MRFDQVARVVHSQRDGLRVRPAARGVLPEPGGRRAVAAFAAHAVVQIEGLGALLRRGRRARGTPGTWAIPRTCRCRGLRAMRSPTAPVSAL